MTALDFINLAEEIENLSEIEKQKALEGLCLLHGHSTIKVLDVNNFEPDSPVRNGSQITSYICTRCGKEFFNQYDQ